MTAYFGFQNLIKKGIVTAEEQAGYPKENAYDWFTYTFWLSPESDSAVYQVDFLDPEGCDYFGIASHNIDDIGGSVRFEYLDIDDGWTIIGTQITPTDNSPIFQIFPPETATQFRFVFDGYSGVSPFIGVLSFGKALQLPVGIEAPFTPPPFYFDNKIFNSISSKGQFLGRSVERFAQKAVISQKNMDPNWMLENWENVIESLEKQAFFYTWNIEEYSQDAVYAWLDGNLPVAKFTDSIHASFDIKCKALHKMRWF